MHYSPKNDVFQNCYISFYFTGLGEGKGVGKEVEVGVWQKKWGEQSFSLKQEPQHTVLWCDRKWNEYLQRHRCPGNRDRQESSKNTVSNAHQQFNSPNTLEYQKISPVSYILFWLSNQVWCAHLKAYFLHQLISLIMDFLIWSNQNTMMIWLLNSITEHFSNTEDLHSLKS